MLLRLHRYLSSVPTVFLDGCIAVAIAVMTAINMSFATDESAKYIDPALRFWLLICVGSSIQGMHALSKFRDRAYSHHMDNKADPRADELVRETVARAVADARAIVEDDKRKNDK